MAEQNMLRVLLVDDQQLVRAGFRMIFEVEDDIEVVGEATTGAQAVSMARALNPDVILMDIQMPEMDGIEATRQITEELDTVVLVLTTFGDENHVLASLQAGASGLLLKNTDPAQLVQGVRSAAEGHGLLAPEVTRHVIDRANAEGGGAAPGGGVDEESRAALELLTDRERETLRYVASGMSNSEIAETLFVGESTVKTHVSSCLSKLHFRDRVQLVVFAFQSGFMEDAAPSGD